MGVRLLGVSSYHSVRDSWAGIHLIFSLLIVHKEDRIMDIQNSLGKGGLKNSEFFDEYKVSLSHDSYQSSRNILNLESNCMFLKSFLLNLFLPALIAFPCNCYDKADKYIIQ